MTAPFAPVRLACASRNGPDSFYSGTLLGQSLVVMPPALRPRCELWLGNVGDSAKGLSAIYNATVDRASPEDIVLLVHDDVYLHDPFICRRLNEALSFYDVVGLAGSRGTDLDQPSWGLGFDAELEPLGWQTGENVTLSGYVSHLQAKEGVDASYRPPRLAMSEYGPVPVACQLLDGLFLAFRAGTIQKLGVRFDERFDFHLYDLDFCRSALRVGLKLGTWPIVVTHGSGGNFGSPAWRDAARIYQRKWASPDGESEVTVPTGAPP